MKLGAITKDNFKFEIWKLNFSYFFKYYKNSCFIWLKEGRPFSWFKWPKANTSMLGEWTGPVMNLVSRTSNHHVPLLSVELNRNFSPNILTDLFLTLSLFCLPRSQLWQKPLVYRLGRVQAICVRKVLKVLFKFLSIIIVPILFGRLITWRLIRLMDIFHFLLINERFQFFVPKFV